MTSTNPHHEAGRKALELLKSLTASLDGFEFVQEKEGVKLYIKWVEGSAFPIVRGDYAIDGHEFTPAQIFSVANIPGARVIWDEKYDRSEIKEIYNHNETVFWGKVKTPWPISPRDMSATLLRELTDDVRYTAMVSVEDERIPPVSGCVRSTLYISGWKIYKTESGVTATYVTQIDLSGSIPTSFLKNIQIQVPLCAGKVVKYAEKYGFPPYLVEGEVPYLLEEFDHASKTYTVKMSGAGNSAWNVSKAMYPNGVKVDLVGGSGKFSVATSSANNYSTVSVDHTSGPLTVIITSA